MLLTDECSKADGTLKEVKTKGQREHGVTKNSMGVIHLWLLQSDLPKIFHAVVSPNVNPLQYVTRMSTEASALLKRPENRQKQPNIPVSISFHCVSTV